MTPNDAGFAVRDWMNRVMVDEYGTFLQTFWYDGKWWVRLSAQVYLDMRDFEWAAETLKTVCKRVEKGDWMVVKSVL